MTGPANQAIENVRALRAAGHQSEATRVCEQRLGMIAEGAEAAILEGLLLAMRGQANDALTAYDTALSFAPDALAAYQGIAEIMIERGWLFSAAVILEDARRAAAFTPEAETQLAELKVRLASVGRAAHESAT